MISVFTPTHNPKYLYSAYRSLLEQTYGDWEWVVLHNNGSKPIGLEDPRIKEFELDCSPEWVGPLKAAACRRATGDILLELDHDDFLMPTALEECAKAFEDAEIGFVYSNTVHATGDLKKTERYDARYGWEYREVDVDGKVLDEHLSFPPNPDAISKIWFSPNHFRAFRRVVYESIGGYAEDMRVLDDSDLMCRLYQVTKFKHIDKPLYVYRIHGENSWLRYNKEIQDNVFRIHDKYITNLACKWSTDNGLLKIDLGGRLNSKEWAVSVDLKDADVIADLNERWPFEDSSVGVVRAVDVFEHLIDSIHTMKELYRVLAPGGWAFIQVPSTDGRGAFQDPTHKTFWNENSFFYYTKKDYAKYIDSPVRFQASHLYTNEKDKNGVCWTKAHLVSLKDGYRPAGLIEI